MQDKVRQFMLAFGQEVPEELGVPSREICWLRAKLLMEEFSELLHGLGYSSKIDLEKSHEPNLTLIADGIADLHYVTSGTAVACGINEASVFDEVHRSNMSKCWTSTEVSNATKRDAQELYQATGNVEIKKGDMVYTKIGKNRWICRDKAGKVIKSPSYSPADITSKLQ